MKNKLTTKVHRLSKSSGRERRSQSIERGNSENEVLPSIKREFTLSNGSPRKRKVKVRIEGQTPTNGIIPRLTIPKKLFKEKAFDGLANEVPPSIKRKPSFEDNIAEIRKPNVMTERKTSAEGISNKFTRSSQKKENDVFPSVKKKLSNKGHKKVNKTSVKTGRKTSAEEISDLITSSQNEEKEVFSSENEDSTATESSARKEKAHSERKQQSLYSLNTHWEKWSPQRTTPSSTPYALNRPQRNRIPPLAYWRGEHRTFRTLINGDIVLVDFHIPDYTEEPQRKRRKLSEKKNMTNY